MITRRPNGLLADSFGNQILHMPMLVRKSRLCCFSLSRKALDQFQDLMLFARMRGLLSIRY